MSYSTFGGSFDRDPLRFERDQLRSGRSVETAATKLENERGFTRPLAMLIARLNQMAQIGGFTHQDAAALFARNVTTMGGDLPRYHIKDEAGGWRVDRKRVSAQMSPRDKFSPPDAGLVDNFVVLFVKRTNSDPVQVRREVNQRYQDAVQAADRQRRDRRIAEQNQAAEIRQQAGEFAAANSGSAVPVRARRLAGQR